MAGLSDSPKVPAVGNCIDGFWKRQLSVSMAGSSMVSDTGDERSYIRGNQTADSA